MAAHANWTIERHGAWNSDSIVKGRIDWPASTGASYLGSAGRSDRLNLTGRIVAA